MDTPQKTNMAHLKIAPLKRKIIFQTPDLHCLLGSMLVAGSVTLNVFECSMLPWKS